MKNKTSFLTHVPPMGIYETLYAFQNAYGTYMGEKGTHPWSQGFPLTTQIPGGPQMPENIKIDSDDLKYPKAWGQPELRQTIADYYNHYYGSSIDLENVMIFAGGRPGLIALLMFLEPDIQVRIASTEYTPYYDMLRLMNRDHDLIDSTVENSFNPTIDEYIGNNSNQRKLVLLSNPCNPTGITRKGNELKELVERASFSENGLLVDEAYELFQKFKRIEDAGAFSAECEVIPENVMGEISKRTDIVTVSLCSGKNADVMYLFMEDICGDTKNPPRHSKAYGNLLRLRGEIKIERVKALRAFKKDSMTGKFPGKKQSSNLEKKQFEEFLDQLN